MPVMVHEVEQYYSPKQLAQRLDDFTERQIRWCLFNRKQNGLDKYVRKIGRRVYISERGWSEWLSQQYERG